MICFVRSASSIVLIKPLVCKAARLACGQRARSGYVSGTSVQLGGHPLRVYCSPMRRTISIVGALILVACGGASETSDLFEGAGAGGSSGALTPDADSGAEDGAAGEDGAAPMVCAPGKVEACACPGGGKGAQACREDGSG